MKRTFVQIAPSLLAADFSKLGQEIDAVRRGGADRLHLDIMDGHFVPNLTFGPALIESIRPCTNMPFDVHLMVDSPQQFIQVFIDAGADVLIIHVEINDPLPILKLIKSYGKKAGLSLNPDTHFEALFPYLPYIDHILVMSVHPGFGGQEFIESQIEKTRCIRRYLDSKNYEIELSVDGGVNQFNSGSLIQAGAGILVAGSSIFKKGIIMDEQGETIDYSTAIESLKKA